MNLLSVISYVFSGLLIYLSFIVAEGQYFKPLSYWDLSSFLIIMSGFFIILFNFKFSEIYNAIIDALSKNKREGFEERYELNKIVVNSIGTYTLFSSILASIVAVITILGNLADMSKLGPSIAIVLITFLYWSIIRLFFVAPLNISLDKKMIKAIK